jgi:hypothetical protein
MKPRVDFWFISSKSHSHHLREVGSHRAGSINVHRRHTQNLPRMATRFMSQ